MATSHISPVIERTRQALWDHAHRPSLAARVDQQIHELQDRYDDWTLSVGVAGVYMLINCQEMATAAMLSGLLAVRHPGHAIALAKSLFSLEHDDLADLWHVAPFAIAYLEQPVQAVEHVISHELKDAQRLGAAALYLVERTTTTAFAIAQHLLRGTS